MREVRGMLGVYIDIIASSDATTTSGQFDSLLSLTVFTLHPFTIPDDSTGHNSYQRFNSQPPASRTYLSTR